jgi:hypothetical protein
VGLNPELVAETAPYGLKPLTRYYLAIVAQLLNLIGTVMIFFHYPLPQRDCALFTKAKTQFFVWGEWLS